MRNFPYEEKRRYLQQVVTDMGAWEENVSFHPLNTLPTVYWSVSPAFCSALTMPQRPFKHLANKRYLIKKVARDPKNLP